MSLNSFNFRKSEEAINSIKRKFFVVDFLRRRIALSIIIALAILFSGVIESVAFDRTQVVPEFNHGHFVTVNSLANDLVGTRSFFISDRSNVEKPLFFYEVNSEICSGLVELLPLHKINSILMSFLDQFHASFISEVCAQSSTAKTSKDSRDSTDNSNTFNGHNTVSVQWMIGYIVLLIILMVCSWAMGLLVFHYFLT